MHFKISIFSYNFVFEGLNDCWGPDKSKDTDIMTIFQAQKQKWQKKANVIGFFFDLRQMLTCRFAAGKKHLIFSQQYFFENSSYRHRRVNLCSWRHRIGSGNAWPDGRPPWRGHESCPRSRD